MEKEEEIRLEKSPDQSGKDVLIGLNGDVTITDRITRAVEASGRLFPYVVEHIAGYKLADSNGDPNERCVTFKGVRDELIASIQELHRQRDLETAMQNDDLAHQVDSVRPPYFAR